jgi:predicted Co/Zn/Cd cation transporter (cation efflux family)
VSKPWLIFIAARIGLFIGFFVLMLLLGFEGIYSAVIAGVLALAVSLVFLAKQRDALSEEIYKKFHRNEFSGVPDKDADIENALLDSEQDDK